MFYQESKGYSLNYHQTITFVHCTSTIPPAQIRTRENNDGFRKLGLFFNTGSPNIPQGSAPDCAHFGQTAKHRRERGELYSHIKERDTDGCSNASLCGSLRFTLPVSCLQLPLRDLETYMILNTKTSKSLLKHTVSKLFWFTEVS